MKTICKIRELAHNVYAETINQIADIIDEIFRPIQTILMTELKVTLVAFDFVLILLTSVQKKHQVTEYQNLSKCDLKDHPLLSGLSLVKRHLTLKNRGSYCYGNVIMIKYLNELQFNEDHKKSFQRSSKMAFISM